MICVGDGVEADLALAIGDDNVRDDGLCPVGLRGVHVRIQFRSAKVSRKNLRGRLAATAFIPDAQCVGSGRQAGHQLAGRGRVNAVIGMIEMPVAGIVAAGYIAKTRAR